MLCVLGGKQKSKMAGQCGQLVPWGKTTFVVRRTVLIGGIEKKISSSTEFLKKKSYGKYGYFTSGENSLNQLQTLFCVHSTLLEAVDQWTPAVLPTSPLYFSIAITRAMEEETR